MVISKSKIEQDKNKQIEREKFIGKGGHVPSDLVADQEKKEWTNFTLRIKSSMSSEIDEILKDKVGITKTGYMLQAIQEKIKSERSIN